MSIDALPIEVLVPVGLPLAALLLALWLWLLRREARTLAVSVERTVLHPHARPEVHGAEQHDRADEPAEDDRTHDVVHARIVARGGAR